MRLTLNDESDDPGSVWKQDRSHHLEPDVESLAVVAEGDVDVVDMGVCSRSRYQPERTTTNEWMGTSPGRRWVDESARNRWKSGTGCQPRPTRSCAECSRSLDAYEVVSIERCLDPSSDPRLLLLADNSLIGSIREPFLK
jgi:hypothetical protein